MKEKTLQTENIMGTLPVNRLLLTMAWPMILSMFIQGCYNLVDSIFVANVSQDAFIALSLVYPVQMLLISVNVGLGVGINTLLSRRLGERRQKEANDVAAHGVVLYLILGVLFAIIGALIAHPFMTLFSDVPAVIEAGTVYLGIVTLFSTGVCLQFAGERVMQATGNPIWNMYIQATGAIINLILDPILIFGLFGFPALGIAGAAIATVIGQWCGALIGVYAMAKKVRQIHISLRGFRLKKEILGPIFRIGLPATVVQSLATVMCLVLNKLYVNCSQDHVAVLGAYFKLQNFIFMVVFGLGNAVVPIISFNYGARSRSRVTGSIRAAMITALTSMAIGMIILLLFTDPLLSLFKLSPAAMEIGHSALRIISLSFVLAGAGLVFSYVFQAVGYNSYSLFLAVLRQIVVLLPLVAVLLQVDPNLSWWAFPIAECACFALAVVLFRRAYQKRIAVLED